MTRVKEKLTSATLKVLRPLIRLLIRHGVSHSEFSELARRVFVEVGFNDFPVEERRQTVSRVAVLTGLSRKEVLRLKLALENDEFKELKPINRAVRVTNGWQNDSEFCDSSGKAKALPLYGETGSFAALVKRYSGDITSGAVLDELVRVGAARLEEDRVQLCANGYVPQREIEEKIAILGICATDLLETLDHNINNNNPADNRFQRAVIYHHVSSDLVQKFKHLSSEKSSELLSELNRWLAKNTRSESTGNKSDTRIGLGIYYFENNVEPNDEKK